MQYCFYDPIFSDGFDPTNQQEENKIDICKLMNFRLVSSEHEKKNDLAEKILKVYVMDSLIAKYV